MALEAWKPETFDPALLGRWAIGLAAAVGICTYTFALITLAGTPEEKQALLPTEAEDIAMKEEPAEEEPEKEEEPEPEEEEPPPPPPPPTDEPPPPQDAAPAMAKGDQEVETPPDEIEKKELKEKEPVKKAPPKKPLKWGSKTGCDPKKDPNCVLKAGARTDGKPGGTGKPGDKGDGDKPKPKPKIKKKKRLYRAVDIAVPPRNKGCAVGFAPPPNVEGTAVVRYIVTEFGSVVGAKAIRGPAALREPCARRYASCKFSPAKLADGSSVATARFGRCTAKLR